MPNPLGRFFRDRGPMATDMNEVLARLKRRWLNEGIELLPPAAPADIHATFARLAAVATPDVIALYTTLGGMSEMDKSYLLIWSLEGIAKQTPSSEGVVFADYMISSWEYRLIRSPGACNAVLVDQGDGVVKEIGPTLEAFLASLEEDPAFLHAFV